jgi:hypothetical protein
MENKKSMVIHPFLFAIFPVLYLYSHNIREVFLKWTLAPAAITLVCTFLLWVVLVFLCKEKNRAGLLLSLFAVYFFSYGHFVGTLRNFWTAARKFGSQTWLFSIWTAAFLVAAYFAFKIRKHTTNLTKIMNVIAFCLIGFSLINIVRFESESAILREDTIAVWPEGSSSFSKVQGTCPNIYYIILDAYAGNDILKESFDYDNSTFLEQLSHRGFFVANKSRANYVKTVLSLPSSLNFTHLDDLAKRVGTTSGDRKPLRELIVNNRVFSFLKRYGYSTVAFPAGFHLTELRGADVYMSKGWSLDDFSGELIYNTPVSALVEIFMNQPFKHILHRQRVLYSFDHLIDTTKIKPPIFVFAHIVCPHKPFVFDEDGGPVGLVKSPADFSEKMYVEQLKYVNKRVIRLVDELLANSVQPPIIILQADHGVRWNVQEQEPERNTPQIYKKAFSILNAYYLPGCDYSQLYDSISPVNTFRVVLNWYFGAEFELLKDESYFSTKAQPYNFIDVTAELN